MVAKADINFQKDLFEAATNMRGSVAPADYKHYVLPLIFLRYLSNRYEMRKEEIDSLVKDPKSDWYASDEETQQVIKEDPDMYMSENVYVVPEESRWNYILSNAKQPNIKEILDNAMKRLEEENPDLEGMMPRIFQGSNLPTENVSGLIEIFSRDIFSTRDERSVDVLGRVYEYFISEFASTEGQRGGEFYTPYSVVSLLVRMLEPIKGTVFDPACGSGGMFIQSEEYSPRRHELSFYGQENVTTTARLGKMNVLLHGLNADMRLGNSLLDDKYPDLKADYVIANPPFNQDGWGADRISNDDPRLIGPITDSNANYMWMQHFFHHLNDTGSAGYVMANGAMTTNQRGEKPVREWFVNNGYIDCIVALPEKLFLSTGISCCLYFLSKNRDGKGDYRNRKNEILFIDARQKGSLVSRKQKALTEEEIIEIAEVYHIFKFEKETVQDIPGFCKVVTIDEVKGKDYNLAPGIYVGTEEVEEDGVPFEEKAEELKKKLFEHFEEASNLQEKIKKDLEELF
jgi:type I restriction enzyme M protein